MNIFPTKISEPQIGQLHVESVGAFPELRAVQVGDALLRGGPGLEGGEGAVFASNRFFLGCCVFWGGWGGL